jgi:hypothetical protein
MFTWLSHLGRHVAQVRRLAVAGPRPRYRPILEGLERRDVPSNTSLTAAPNPGMLNQSVAFTVTVTSTNMNSTDLTGSVTLTDTSTGAVLGTAKVMGFGSPPIPITITQGFAAAFGSAGDHFIQASFTSNTPGETSSQATRVEHITEPDNIVVPPGITIKRLLTAHKGKHRIKQVVKIGNSTKAPISGNLFLVVDGLTPGITLDGAAGVTTVHPPLGSPFVALGQRQIKPHKFIKVTLTFEDPQGLPLHDTFRLLSGTTTL